MKVYIGNNRNPLHRGIIASAANKLGLMFTPIDYNQKYPYSYALDNGAYSAFINERDFDESSFLLALEKLKRPDFVVIPDKVCQGKKSLEYSAIWRRWLPDSFDWYLAVQDGMTTSMIPISLLEKIAGLFVGGSMEWKMETSANWVEFAHGMGLKCHIGRIGTLQRIMWAHRIGADSIDSTNFAKHPKNMDGLLQWLRGEHRPLEEHSEVVPCQC